MSYASSLGLIRTLVLAIATATSTGSLLAQQLSVSTDGLPTHYAGRTARLAIADTHPLAQGGFEPVAAILPTLVTDQIEKQSPPDAARVLEFRPIPHEVSPQPTKPASPKLRDAQPPRPSREQPPSQLDRPNLVPPVTAPVVQSPRRDQVRAEDRPNSRPPVYDGLPNTPQSATPSANRREQADNPSRMSANPPREREGSAFRPPVYDGRPKQDANTNSRDANRRPPQMRDTPDRDREHGDKQQREKEGDDEDEDDDECDCDLEQSLETLEALLDSRLIKQQLSVFEQNMELKCQLKIQEVEMRCKLELQELRFQYKLEELERKAQLSHENREQARDQDRGRANEAEMDEMRQILSQRERELMQARTMNEQLEKVANKSRELMEEATSKMLRDFEDAKRDNAELEHRARALETKLEQAQSELSQRAKVEKRPAEKAEEKKPKSGEKDKLQPRKKTEED